MSLELTLQSDTYLDFAFGTVTPGKEMQVFAEYFPIIHPVLAEHGIQPLGSFMVLATNNPGQVPGQGALTQVPSPENFAQFHNDSRFLEAKPIRDDAMEFLTDGNFFKSQDVLLALDAQCDYALVIAQGTPLDAEPVLSLNHATNSPKNTYAGKSMTLHPWSQEAEQLLNGDSNNAEVFRIRFNPANA